jgi:hypothetical protein
MNLSITIDLEIVDFFENKDIVSRIYYPDEGNKIQIIKGRNKLEFSKDILHEVGHLFDWYVSQQNQSDTNK